MQLFQERNCKSSQCLLLAWFKNPRVFQEVYTLQLQKLSVWAGIFGDRVVWALLPGNWTGEMYLKLLEDVINSPLMMNLIFQQNGIPHYALLQYLHQFSTALAW